MDKSVPSRVNFDHLMINVGNFLSRTYYYKDLETLNDGLELRSGCSRLKDFFVLQRTSSACTVPIAHDQQVALYSIDNSCGAWPTSRLSQVNRDDIGNHHSTTSQIPTNIQFPIHRHPWFILN